MQHRIVYSVRLLEQDCQVFTMVYYATVIEKKYRTLPVEFDVQYKN
jgi:hypothetical protein